MTPGATPGVGEILSAGPGHAVWVATGTFGTSFWGPHSPGTHESFYDEVERGMRTLDAPFDYIADTRRLKLGDQDWRSVERGFRWMRAKKAFLEEVTRRAIILAPNHALGWAILGTQKVMGMRYPTSVAATMEEALALIGHPDAAELAPWVDGLPEAVRARSSELVRLGDYLQRTPGAELAQAARFLGLGERSLQRTLAAHGTSFREERQRARSRARHAGASGVRRPGV